MTPTAGDTEAFLSALAPDGELTFQTFDDAKRGRKGLSRILHGAYRTNAQVLADLNRRGAGCFVMVNRGDGTGRSIANVKSVRALFLDLDGAPLEPVLAAPIRPPIVCESSPGKFHAYWPIEGLPLQDFRRAQKAIAAHYGGDATVCDLPRVMRLPGLLHLKGEPFRSRLLHCDAVKPWNWADFAASMGLALARTHEHPGPILEGERNNSLHRFACKLRRQGLGLAEALRSVQAMNSSRCAPPLDDSEVVAIVSSAWNGDISGFVMLPYSLLDSPAFLDLPHASKVAILALARAYNGYNNGNLTCTRTTAKRWGLDKRSRTRALQIAEMAGLIDCTEHGKSATPGRRATTDRFRLCHLPDRGQIDPYAAGE